MLTRRSAAKRANRMDDQIKQHQRLARQGGDPQESGNFGVKPFNDSHKPNSEPKGGKTREMKDGQRGIMKTRGYHPEPDHGPME